MGVMGGIVTCQAFEKEDKRLGRCRDEKLMLNAIVVQLYVPLCAPIEGGIQCRPTNGVINQ
jgi:hypothetical protein